jgi:hypothetical protein
MRQKWFHESSKHNSWCCGLCSHTVLAKSALLNVDVPVLKCFPSSLRTMSMAALLKANSPASVDLFTKFGGSYKAFATGRSLFSIRYSALWRETCWQALPPLLTSTEPRVGH